MVQKILQILSNWLSDSFVFSRARTLWEKNKRDFNLPLSKPQKFGVGSYVILKDFAQGVFPPVFPDRKKAYTAEIKYKLSIPGVNAKEMTDFLLRRPFYFGPSFEMYMRSFLHLVEDFQRLKIQPPQKIMELGCGTGWMAEFFSIMGFSVLGTSISRYEIDDARCRSRSLKTKKLACKLDFQAIPMESVDLVIPRHGLFDCVYVFEALHHAFNWREAIHAGYRCLKPGGWLIIANEPNILHTFISYRVAKLSNTHEIGFSFHDLRRSLDQAGFTKIIRLRNHASFFLKPIWIAAQK